jgi:hypothetical protein
MNKVDYGPLLGGDYFAGKCEYMNACPDIKKLEESQINKNVNEDLADQRIELCLVGGRCLTKKSLEEKSKIEIK